MGPAAEKLSALLTSSTALGCFFSWPEQKQTMLMIIMIKLQVIVKIATAKQILIRLVLYNK